jgi:hypothetical protein
VIEFVQDHVQPTCSVFRRIEDFPIYNAAAQCITVEGDFELIVAYLVIPAQNCSAKGMCEETRRGRTAISLTTCAQQKKVRETRCLIIPAVIRAAHCYIITRHVD